MTASPNKQNEITDIEKPVHPKMKALRLLGSVWTIPLILLGVSFPLFSEISRDLASLPSSPLKFKNWGISNDSANSHINALNAWKIEEGSKNVVVAIIDTGIDPTHPDLRANVWFDKDGKTYGYDFVTKKSNPTDSHGHGTHVAGIIGAALNRQAGISGVAHKVSLMAVRYYSDSADGTENLRNSIRAINWAIDHGAHIINYSGGGPEFSMDEYIALKRAQTKNILVVAAAGNERSNGDVEGNFYYPCAYRLENIVCVAATNIQNKLLPSSNWGKSSVDVAAPGEGILSTIPKGKYDSMSGTSQATAFVTGVSALLLSKKPGLKASEMKDILRQAVDPVEGLKDKIYSGGKINAALALSLLDRKTIFPDSSPMNMLLAKIRGTDITRKTANKNLDKSLDKSKAKVTVKAKAKEAAVTDN